MRLSITSPLSATEAKQAVEAAAAATEHPAPLPGEGYIESLLTFDVRGIMRHVARAGDPSLRAEVRGATVIVKPNYEAPRFLGQTFRGLLQETHQGVALEGRVSTWWWGVAFFGVSLTFATLAGAVACLMVFSGVGQLNVSPAYALGAVGLMVGGGWLIFWYHWRQSRRERKKIIGFLHNSLQAV